MTSKVLTVKQFAELYALNPATVSAQVTRNPEGLPRFIRIGKQIRFPVEEVERWEKAQLERHH